jgi:uncharacterized membrane protein
MLLQDQGERDDPGDEAIDSAYATLVGWIAMAFLVVCVLIICVMLPLQIIFAPHLWFGPFRPH